MGGGGGVVEEERDATPLRGRGHPSGCSFPPPVVGTLNRRSVSVATATAVYCGNSSNCARERQTDRHRQTDPQRQTQTDRHTKTETQTDRHTETETQRQRSKNRETHRERERETETHRQRQRETERHSMSVMSGCKANGSSVAIHVPQVGGTDLGLGLESQCCRPAPSRTSLCEDRGRGPYARQRFCLRGCTWLVRRAVQGSRCRSPEVKRSVGEDVAGKTAVVGAVAVAVTVAVVL